MCILFIYNGFNDPDSDYAAVVISNRDEFYDRPSSAMAPWTEDYTVVGGRDLQSGCDNGTWLGFSPKRKKLGVLLNLPGKPKDNAKSRGMIVADYVRNDKPATLYVEDMKNDAKECNDFIFVSLELINSTPTIQAYNNVTDEIIAYTDTCVGFGNSLPQNPLKKVEAGKQMLQHICTKYKKVTMKKAFIEELFHLLKSEERHLPDQQLETRRPDLYKELSSIFVCVPKGRYGTRTHSLLLITKGGHADLIEHTMQEPIDPLNPTWVRSEFQFDIEF
ncbi:transport and Golgi organization protein 2 [Manduca sexta]|uniref:transport and Golgi organization protein 2 n=1 Tax=Manduca sexta TaxID=7130 RepID=UPI00188E5065|nr:transport and Golgi organization protein 2 [Manduca sexta]XP_030024480.2 transport and Golgi organization protein 2 [Manduca sexta]XP_037292849.1 transport and Golgi organization protein 2 [Manduca sexta]XP_037292851.1 transport and Golgi organization protein 2 [Manduca sexta]